MKVLSVCRVIAILIAVGQVSADRGHHYGHRDQCDRLMSDWSDWGSCSASCEGVGVQTRTKTEFEVETCDNREVRCWSGDFCVLPEQQVAAPFSVLEFGITQPDCKQLCAASAECRAVLWYTSTYCYIYNEAGGASDADLVAAVLSASSTATLYVRIELYSDAGCPSV